MIVYGLNPVIEALRAGRVRKLRVGPRADRRIEEAVALARQVGVPIERADLASLDRAARGGVHQGLAADVESPRDYGIDDLVAGAAPDAPLIVVLDGVEDPHNVGAILRSIDAAGGHGVVRQARHAASLDGVVKSLRGPSRRTVGGLFGRWDEAVGEQIAAHVRPVKLDGGVLSVDVDDPAWATQVQFLAPTIIARLAEVTGASVERLQVRVDPRAARGVRR